jgi:hypothetical protein
MSAEGAEGTQWLAIGTLLCMLLPIGYLMHSAHASKFSPASTHVAAMNHNPDPAGLHPLTERAERQHCSCTGPSGAQLENFASADR